jgi:hypothetical protein
LWWLIIFPAHEIARCVHGRSLIQPTYSPCPITRGN